MLQSSRYANAQTPSTNQKRARSTFRPPNRGAPGNRIAAASRNGCPILNRAPVALIPARDLNLTFSERPTFWFYVPVFPPQARMSEFILQDPEYNDVYRTSFTLPEKSGIISVTLPATNQKVLELNRTHRWFFKINCNPQDKSAYFLVDGKVERVSPNQYPTENIWFDNFTNLAENIKTAPQTHTSKEEWIAFLKDGDLIEFAKEPFLSCCTAQK
nr:DUF928 domain-containing protein [Scytonema sp. UIC 10036]